jgi:DNA-binding PadR family transcriptional regulator
MLYGHPLIATELTGVLRRAAEYLAPPGGHIAAVLCVHAAREERREQLILLDPVVERVDHRIKRIASARPLVQRRMIAHRANVPREEHRDGPEIAGHGPPDLERGGGGLIIPTMRVCGEHRLSLSEWVVLCLVCEGPTHGFAVAALLARDSELAQIWYVQKTVVYRAMARLEQLGLIRTVGTERSSHGPEKSVSRATPAGQRAARAWLDRPVDHPRDVRSEFLIKLALRHRIGSDASELLRRQHERLVPIAAALTDRVQDATGWQRTLALWRSESIAATLRFLEEVTELATSPS